jgi:pilus assembly protein CpaE
MYLRNLSIVFIMKSEVGVAEARAVMADSRLTYCTCSVVEDGIEGGLTHLSEHGCPDVVFIEDEATDDVWARLEPLADQINPGSKTVLVGGIDSISTYREMIDGGMADYIAAPIRAEVIVNSLMRIFSGENDIPKGKLLIVKSATGGAGASTFACLAAWHLAERFDNGLLIDLNVTQGCDGVLLDIEVRESVTAILGQAGIDAAYLDRVMGRRGKLRVISTLTGPFEPPQFVAIDAVERLVSVCREFAKVVVVDLPSGWNDLDPSLFAVADEIVVVAQPDLISLRNCRQIVDSVSTRRPDFLVPKVVLNKVGISKRDEYGMQDFAESGGTTPMGSVSFNPEPFFTGLAQGVPVSDIKGKAVGEMQSIIERLFVDGHAHRAVKDSKPLLDLARLKALFGKR